MPWILELVICILLLIGGAITLIGAIGMSRFPDFFTRLHGPAKTSTMGVGAALLASMLYFSFSNDTLSIKEVIVLMFLFITAPISAHMLAKAALHHKVKLTARSKNSQLAERAYKQLPPHD